jgi:hypothetical protein
MDPIIAANADGPAPGYASGRTWDDGVAGIGYNAASHKWREGAPAN